jgi:hypothetical protein
MGLNLELLFRLVLVRCVACTMNVPCHMIQDGFGMVCRSAATERGIDVLEVGNEMNRDKGGQVVI